jgi:hypothetical protein
MKKRIYAILTALTVLTLVMMGCSTDVDPDDGKKGETNNVKTLSSMSLAGGDQKVAPGTAARADTLAGVNKERAKEINLPTAVATAGKVAVTLEYPANFKGVAKIAVFKASDTPDESKFETYNDTQKPSFDFVDGDLIYVKMTAEDKTVYYYGYKVFIGWDASLNEDVKFLENNNALEADITLGEPKSSISAIGEEDEGKVQFNSEGRSFTVIVAPNDPAAKVEISINAAATTPTWVEVGEGVTVTYSNDTGNYLYVRVTSSNTIAVNYYKLKVVLLRSVNIPYGTPPSIDASTYNTWWDDPANATDWLDINRINKTETQAIMSKDPLVRSFGRAKLAWDAEGMYIYAQVWEKNITYADGPSDSAYTKSSVELFINESNGRTGTVASSVNENGGQYRLGANNVRSGPQTPITEAFNALDKSDAKAWTAGNFPYISQAPQETSITNGYVVVFQAPWLFPDKYPLVDNKQITIELQINATDPDDPNGGRTGVINWNNENSNSYSSVANFGQATLKLNGKTLGALGATITTQPKNQTIVAGSGTTVSELSVDATSPDGGDLTFAWYKSTDGTISADDAKVADGKTYTPTIDTTAESKSYYYARVTNSKGGGSTVRTSSVATITVYTPVVATGDVELLPVEPKVFTLVEGYATVGNYPFKVDLADYTKLEIWYTVPTPSAAAGQYNNDFFVEFTGSDGAAPTGIDYNASAVLKDADDNFAGLSYNLSAANKALSGGGSAKIEIKNKANGSHKDQEATITSIKLILGTP